MTAVIKTGGKQYSVNKDDIIIIEKLPEEKGEMVIFTEVLMITEGQKIIVGSPFIENATVTAEVLGQDRKKKIIPLFKNLGFGHDQKRHHNSCFKKRLRV